MSFCGMAQSQAVNKSNLGAANIQQDAIKAGRRRSLVECGDVGQSLNPDSKQLHKVSVFEIEISCWPGSVVLFEQRLAELILDYV